MIIDLFVEGRCDMREDVLQMLHELLTNYNEEVEQVSHILGTVIRNVEDM